MHRILPRPKRPSIIPRACRNYRREKYQVDEDEARLSEALAKFERPNNSTRSVEERLRSTQNVRKDAVRSAKYAKQEPRPPEGIAKLEKLGNIARFVKGTLRNTQNGNGNAGTTAKQDPQLSKEIAKLEQPGNIARFVKGTLRNMQNVHGNADISAKQDIQLSEEIAKFRKSGNIAQSVEERPWNRQEGYRDAARFAKQEPRPPEEIVKSEKPGHIARFVQGTPRNTSTPTAQKYYEIVVTSTTREPQPSKASVKAVRMPQIPQIDSSYQNIELEEFRRRAFVPELPLLMKKQSSDMYELPAIKKWFIPHPERPGHHDLTYLHEFGTTNVPYEFNFCEDLLLDESNTNWRKSMGQYLEGPPQRGFSRFSGPLTLFLVAQHEVWPHSLYIAQAQIMDLPRPMQEDLPTPKLVNEAGKGDIYDANLWMGTPDTFTPLHKDPNPNLFVQLVGNKQVRLFPPDVGRTIFYQVQKDIGQNASSSFRGEEMMEGPERRLLGRAVWGRGLRTGTEYSEKGFHAEVGPGDALFIPKGWWHSIRSTGELTASVNWWFR